MNEYCECDLDAMCELHLEEISTNPPYYDEWLAAHGRVEVAA